MVSHAQSNPPPKELSKLIIDLLPRSAGTESLSTSFGPHYQSYDQVKKSIPNLRRISSNSNLMLTKTASRSAQYISQVNIEINNRPSISAVDPEELFWDIVVGGPQAFANIYEFVPRSALTAANSKMGIEKYLITNGLDLTPIVCFNPGGSGGNYSALYNVKSKDKSLARLLIDSSKGSMGSTVRLTVFLAEIDADDIPGIGVRRDPYDVAPGIGLCNINY